MRERNRTRFTTTVVPPLALMIVMIAGLPTLSPAEERSPRSRCVDARSAGGGPVDPFRALTREYITEALSGEDPLGNQAKGDEIADGALVIMVTHTGRAAKLVASRDGRGLRIHKLVIYDANGAEASHRGPLRLPENATLDVAGARVNPADADGDVRWARTGSVQAMQPLNGARLRGLVSIPVVAHFMKSRDEFYQNNDVEDTFSMSKLQSLLAPTATLNTIWRQAGVFFFVHRAERCSYLLQDFRPDVGAGALETVPSPANDCLALFNKINGAYNSRAVPSLDVYVWWNVGVVGLMGYGAPHKKMGAARQHGAIWLDKACIDPNDNPFGDCGHTLAHEGGHFLGLCHKCLTAPTPQMCGFCLGIPACDACDDGFLMRDDARGQRIPVSDIGVARAKALERFTGSVQRRSN
jgi:hypothetical protein